jgi:hypothetical protein
VVRRGLESRMDEYTKMLAGDAKLIEEHLKMSLGLDGGVNDANGNAIGSNTTTNTNSNLNTNSNIVNPEFEDSPTTYRSSVSPEDARFRRGSTVDASGRRSRGSIGTRGSTVDDANANGIDEHPSLLNDRRHSSYQFRPEQPHRERSVKNRHSSVVWVAAGRSRSPDSPSTLNRRASTVDRIQATKAEAAAAEREKRMEEKKRALIDRRAQVLREKGKLEMEAKKELQLLADAQGNEEKIRNKIYEDLSKIPEKVNTAQNEMQKMLAVPPINIAKINQMGNQMNMEARKKVQELGRELMTPHSASGPGAARTGMLSPSLSPLSSNSPLGTARSPFGTARSNASRSKSNGSNADGNANGNDTNANSGINSQRSNDTNSQSPGSSSRGESHNGNFLKKIKPFENLAAENLSAYELQSPSHTAHTALSLDTRSSSNTMQHLPRLPSRGASFVHHSVAEQKPETSKSLKKQKSKLSPRTAAAKKTLSRIASFRVSEGSAKRASHRNFARGSSFSSHRDDK